VSSDRNLVQKMQRGDAAAFTEFVDRFGARIHALSRRYSESEADAEDLTQEIVVAICRGIGGFRGDAALSTWVYRVAMNRCLKRAQRVKPDSVPLDDLPLFDARHDPMIHAARRELSERVDAALETLSEGHREVVILHELHGLTYAECAHVLGIPVGTVKSRLSNAFGRLREQLGRYVRGDEEITPITPGNAAVTNCAGGAVGKRL
jgi:RNA polymerase sigma-70 factor, ECF subfamily